MKKILALLLVGMFVLGGCSLFSPAENNDPEVIDAPKTEDITNNVEKDDSSESETDEVFEISDEVAVLYDLTEKEVEEFEEMGFDSETVGPFIDEIKAMGAGPFDFNAELEDVSGGDAAGYAGAYFNEGYRLYVLMTDLPHPEDGFFYEGWVVRESPLSVISTGRADRNLGDYVNSHQSEEDLTDHDLYVLTLEPDDGDPDPAEHIMEGIMVEEE